MASKQQVLSGTVTSSSSSQYTLFCPSEQPLLFAAQHLHTSATFTTRTDWLDTATQKDGIAIGTLAFFFLSRHLLLLADNSFRAFMLRMGCLCPEWASSDRQLHLFGDNSFRTFMLRIGCLCPEWASSDRQLHLLGDNSFRMFMLRMGIYAPNGHTLTDIFTYSVTIPYGRLCSAWVIYAPNGHTLTDNFTYSVTIPFGHLCSA